MASLEESLELIAEKIENHSGTILTEEAVKTAAVLPFLHALGYDVFNPLEVVPEYTADAVGKKGEKVDYAVNVDGEIRLLIECKPVSSELDSKHLSQLYRYFSVTNAKFAVLTNGRYFQFYTDLDAPNKLDKQPFLTFDVCDYNAATLGELKKFERAAFNRDNILVTAERMKYTHGIKKNILAEIENPTEGFMRHICANVYAGRMTSSAIEMLGSVTKNAFREVIADAVKNRLSTALKDTEKQTAHEQEDLEAREDSGIVTTEEEIEGYMIAKSIVREVIDVKRVFIRDAKSYCAILIDDNNRKPLMRLVFTPRKKQIGLFDKDTDERVTIDGLDDIYSFSDQIKATAEKYA